MAAPSWLHRPFICPVCGNEHDTAEDGPHGYDCNPEDAMTDDTERTDDAAFTGEAGDRLADAAADRIRDHHHAEDDPDTPDDPGTPDPDPDGPPADEPQPA